MTSNAIMTREPDKQCSRCHVAKPRSSEFFSPHKRTQDKLDSWCRVCRNDYRAALRQRNADRDLEYARSYREANKEACLERTRQWRANNPDYHKRKAVEWRETHQEQYREYLDKTKDTRARISALWATENPAKVNAKTQRYRARKKGNGGTHSAGDIQAQINGQTDKAGQLHCWWCGCVIDTYHVDHAIPLALGGSNDAGNIVISCASCNWKKNAKTPHEFMGRLL